MRFIYPLFLIWSLLSCTFVVSAQQAKGLRYDKDIYTVERAGDTYYVYTPYYTQNFRRAIVTKLIFPSNKPDLITVASAWNGREKPHADGSPRLHLSDVIQAVASSRHANRPLKSLNRMNGLNVVNKETLVIINDYFHDWQKLNPGAKFPQNLTITPSSSFWPSFKSTPFFKAVKWTFNETDKTVGSINITPKGAGRGPATGWFSGADMWCQMERLKH
ncbi:hypothetical protein CGRA01v4_12529 [Colletotrichum graminicola]|nr:hypothetical protein CGRA01v4_12529 [Colletotrichum graminicola]